MIDRYNNLREQTYSTIREMIISQELVFGQKISIAELSRELQISNSPIREAVSKLEADGLVINNPNVGPSVISMTPEIFYSLTQTITVLMTGSYLECVSAHTTEALAQMLEERLEKQKALFPLGLTLEYAATAIAFDRSFVDICNNQLLSKLFASRFDLLMLSTYYVHLKRPQATVDNLAEHEKLLAAVKAGNPGDVTSLIASHIRDQAYVAP